jgi:hypothetical protein
MNFKFAAILSVFNEVVVCLSKPKKIVGETSPNLKVSPFLLLLINLANVRLSLNNL